jgi:hypothetical protein
VGTNKSNDNARTRPASGAHSFPETLSLKSSLALLR